MAQAASPIPAGQHHLYRVDHLPTFRPPRRTLTTSQQQRRRVFLNSYHHHLPHKYHELDYSNSLSVHPHEAHSPSSSVSSSSSLTLSSSSSLSSSSLSLFSTPPSSTLRNPASPRSCVHSFPISRNMPVAVESAHHNDALPGSPPDLTESKSSKSSGSFRTSCLTDTTGPENLSHFEEIALADSSRSSVDVQHHNIVEPKAMTKPAQKRHTTGPVYKHNGVQSVDTFRDTTNIKRPRYPGLKSNINVVVQEQHRTAPQPRALRRGFTSPSAITIGTMSLSSARDQSSSRSPSPSGRMSNNGSLSPHSIGSRSNSFSSNHRNFTRRASMQPRKTIQELEEEYHDSDEEVPEDAVIWNVPISPRPPFGASTPSSPKRSTSGTYLAPEQASHSSLPRADAPPSPRRPGLPHSATVAAFPPDQISLRAKGRTKSWTQDLSDEARELTAALEAHAEEERLQGEQQRSSPSAQSSLDNNKLRTKTTVIELPPLQKGNIMIDPLPISKEKEAVLTRTRPSWLPPKSQKEERKHLREWEQMMAKAAEAEKRRSQREADEAKSKKTMTYSLAKIWDQHVLPDWDNVIRQPRTRELWWRGITPRSRGLVWAKAISNELSLTQASYDAALGRAKALQASIADLPIDEQQKHKDGAWISAIARDVPTVYPETGIFSKGAALHDTLMDVLLAYSAYRSDVGYVYGTHTIAGLLVLNLSAFEAFVALANLLNRPMALAYLVNDNAGIKRAQAMVLATLKYKIPKLHAHLADEKTDVEPGEWLSPFLMTMGTMHLAPEACSRLWDVSVFEADKSIVRAAIGVLSLLENKLYGNREEILSLLGWGAEKWSFGEEEFMTAVREAGKVSTPQEKR